MKGWVALKGDGDGRTLMFRAASIGAVTVREKGGSFIWGAGFSDDACFIVQEDQATVMKKIEAAEADETIF